MAFSRSLSALGIIFLFFCTSVLVVSSILRPSDISQTTFIAVMTISQFVIYFAVLLILFGKWKPGKNSKLILVGLASLVAIFFFLTNFSMGNIGSYEASLAIYVFMALTASIILILDHVSEGGFSIGWGQTNFSRDTIAMAALFSFVFLVSIFFSVLNNQPFETVPFLGVPFQAAQALIENSYFNALISFCGGAIEAFFFTSILGLLYRGVDRFVGLDSVAKKVGFILLLAVIMGYFTSFVHTGLYNEAQRTTLGYIFLYFFFGAVTTAYLETSYPAAVSQGLIDAAKRLSIRGETFGFYGIIFFVVAVGSLFLFRYLSGKKKRGLFI